MKCLRAILGVTLLDRIRNQKIRKQLGIERTIIDIIRKKRLQWFGHVMRLPESSYVRKAYKDDFNKKRTKGRPPKRWTDQIKNDVGIPLLTAEKYSLDRERWRCSINKNVARLSGVCK